MSFARPRRVLIYRLGSLGDMLVALPALRLVRQAFPHAERRLLTNLPVDRKAPAAEAVFAQMGLVDGYMSYPRATRSLWELARIWWRIIAWRPDVLVYLAAARGTKAARRDRMFFRICGIRRIVGVPLTDDLQANCYGDLPDGPGGRARQDAMDLEPEAERLLRNLRELGTVPADDPASWSLELTEVERAAAVQAIVAETTLEHLRRPMVAVSLGTKVQAKDWGADKWRALLRHLPALLPGHTLLLIGVMQEAATSAAAAAAWVAAGGGPVANLCGLLSPRESAAAMERARLLVCHDSGPMHLAAAVGTPVVAVFSARNIPRVWFPFGQQHRIVYHRVPCWGCDLETCTSEAKRCLSSIPVDEVLRAVAEIVRDGEPASAEPVLAGLPRPASIL